MGFIADIFRPKAQEMPPLPPVQQTKPDPEDKGAKDAVERLRRQMMSAKGRASTILTGGMGLNTPPPVYRKTALGE